MLQALGTLDPLFTVKVLRGHCRDFLTCHRSLLNLCPTSVDAELKVTGVAGAPKASPT